MPLILDGTTGIVANNISTTSQLAKGNMAAGSVVQVVSAVDTNNAVIAAGSNTSYSPAGLSITITPSKASNKVLIMGHHHQVANNGNGDHHRFYVRRNGTDVSVGTSASGFNTFGSGGMDNNNYGGNINAGPNIASWSFLDSPNSTSALTYQVVLEFKSGTSQTTVSTGVGYYNRSASGLQTYTATITAMEIAQ